MTPLMLVLFARLLCVAAAAAAGTSTTIITPGIAAEKRTAAAAYSSVVLLLKVKCISIYIHPSMTCTSKKCCLCSILTCANTPGAVASFSNRVSSQRRGGITTFIHPYYVICTSKRRAPSASAPTDSIYAALFSYNLLSSVTGRSNSCQPLVSCKSKRNFSSASASTNNISTPAFLFFCGVTAGHPYSHSPSVVICNSHKQIFSLTSACINNTRGIAFVHSPLTERSTHIHPPRSCNRKRSFSSVMTTTTAARYESWQKKRKTLTADHSPGVIYMHQSCRTMVRQPVGPMRTSLISVTAVASEGRSVNSTTTPSTLAAVAAGAARDAPSSMGPPASPQTHSVRRPCIGILHSHVENKDVRSDLKPVLEAQASQTPALGVSLTRELWATQGGSRTKRKPWAEQACLGKTKRWSSFRLATSIPSITTHAENNFEVKTRIAEQAAPVAVLSCVSAHHLSSSVTAKISPTNTGRATQSPTTIHKAAESPATLHNVATGSRSSSPELTIIMRGAVESPSTSHMAGESPTPLHVARKSRTALLAAAEPSDTSHAAATSLTITRGARESSATSYVATGSPTTSHAGPESPTVTGTAAHTPTTLRVAARSTMSLRVLPELPSTSCVAAESPTTSHVAAQAPTASRVVAESPTTSHAAAVPATITPVATDSFTRSHVAAQSPTASLGAEQSTTPSGMVSPLTLLIAPESPAITPVVARSPAAVRTVAESPPSSLVVAQSPSTTHVATESPSTTSVATEPPTTTPAIAKPPLTLHMAGKSPIVKRMAESGYAFTPTRDIRPPTAATAAAALADWEHGSRCEENEEKQKKSRHISQKLQSQSSTRTSAVFELSSSSQCILETLTSTIEATTVSSNNDNTTANESYGIGNLLMRAHHNRRRNKLGRPYGHRRCLLRNLCTQVSPHRVARLLLSFAFHDVC